MDNKKYLNKVIGSMVRGTKIDYEEERITYPFSLPSPYTLSSFSCSLHPSSSFPLTPFSDYCKTTFGLTDDEIEYVWDRI